MGLCPNVGTDPVSYRQLIDKAIQYAKQQGVTIKVTVIKP